MDFKNDRTPVAGVNRDPERARGSSEGNGMKDGRGRDGNWIIAKHFVFIRFLPFNQSAYGRCIFWTKETLAPRLALALHLEIFNALFALALPFVAILDSIVIVLIG